MSTPATPDFGAPSFLWTFSLLAITILTYAGAILNYGYGEQSLFLEKWSFKEVKYVFQLCAWIVYLAFVIHTGIHMNDGYTLTNGEGERVSFIHGMYILFFLMYTFINVGKWYMSKVLPEQVSDKIKEINKHVGFFAVLHVIFYGGMFVYFSLMISIIYGNGLGIKVHSGTNDTLFLYMRVFIGAFVLSVGLLEIPLFIYRTFFAKQASNKMSRKVIRYFGTNVVEEKEECKENYFRYHIRIQKTGLYGAPNDEKVANHGYGLHLHYKTPIPMIFGLSVLEFCFWIFFYRETSLIWMTTLLLILVPISAAAWNGSFGSWFEHWTLSHLVWFGMMMHVRVKQFQNKFTSLVWYKPNTPFMVTQPNTWIHVIQLALMAASVMLFAEFVYNAGISLFEYWMNEDEDDYDAIVDADEKRKKNRRVADHA